MVEWRPSATSQTAVNSCDQETLRPCTTSLCWLHCDFPQVPNFFFSPISPRPLGSCGLLLIRLLCNSIWCVVALLPCLSFSPHRLPRLPSFFCLLLLLCSSALALASDCPFSSSCPRLSCPPGCSCWLLFWIVFDFLSGPPQGRGTRAEPCHSPSVCAPPPFCSPLSLPYLSAFVCLCATLFPNAISVCESKSGQ